MRYEELNGKVEAVTILRDIMWGNKQMVKYFIEVRFVWSGDDFDLVPMEEKVRNWGWIIYFEVGIAGRGGFFSIGVGSGCVKFIWSVSLGRYLFWVNE